jgi:competence protein ComEC
LIQIEYFRGVNAIQFPLSRVTIAFIFGILFANFVKIDSIWATFLIAISFILFCYNYFWTQKQFSQNNLFGFSTYFLSFSIGVFSLMIHSGWNQKNNYIHHIQFFEKPYELEVVVREKLKTTSFSQRYIAIVKSVDSKDCSGKIILNFNKKSIPRDIRIGTQFKLFTPLISHKPPLNPNQFDYGKYLTTKSILAQCYLDEGSIQIHKETLKDAFYYSDVLRTKLLTNLYKAHFRPTELNVLAALILGQQQDISQDIVHDYQMAGAIHILSVSGLHVGFIVIFIGFLLKFLPKTKWSNYFKLAIILISLWGFAFIAGLSPSVIRSVTMFSFIAIGMHLKRKTNAFHTLLVSLLLILLFEPSFLFDVGFQLSYLALFFILWMQPLLVSIWQPENKITGYFWNILTVSFAAQLGTLPLSIYYFHQFPGLFFVTNLVVIPFLSGIMALGLLLMALSLFDITPFFLVNTVENLISGLNLIINKVASFDQFVFTGIPLNEWMAITLYLAIIAFVLYFSKPDFRRIIFVFISLILLQACYFYTHWKTQTQKEWIVFNVKKTTLITDRNEDKISVYKDFTTIKNNPLDPYLVANYSKVIHENTIPNLMYVLNKKIVIVDSLGFYPRNVQPDIMLLRKSPRINLDRVFKTCKPKLVIADASNFKSYTTLWKSTCIKEKIPFHNTYEKGFYKLEK